MEKSLKHKLILQKKWEYQEVMFQELNQKQ